jgi:hypothetical protein
MSLTTGGTTTTPAPGNVSAQNLALGQIGSALTQSGGLGQFATPSNLFNLTPGENLFRSSIMGASLPGSMAGQANAYTGPGGQFGNLFQLSPQAEQFRQQGMQGMGALTDPTGGLFHNYLKQFVEPSVINNAIASGYGGASGASMEAMARAGTDAAMRYGSQYPGMVNSAMQLGQMPQNLRLQGLTSLGLPLAQTDYQNLQTGQNAAGQQRNLSLQDQNRIQNLLQSMLGMLPTAVQGGTTTQQGPGTAASLLNLGAGALGNLFNGGLLGSAGSLGGTGLTGLISMLSGSGGNTNPFAADVAASPSTSDLFPSMGADVVPESFDPSSLLESLSGSDLGGGF